jgi:rhomboid protease GluP
MNEGEHAAYTGDSPEIEILPPAVPPRFPGDPRTPGIRYTGAPPGRRRAPQWASAPATYVLIGINCAVFLVMCLFGASPSAPTPHQLLFFGADFGPYVLALDQWWRLVTAMFVHVGWIHLASNMWCLWNLGLLGEPLLGPAGVFAAYLLSGIGGNLLSVAVNPGLGPHSEGIVGAGASGAVFGLAGVLIILLKSKLLPLPPAELSRLRRSVIWFAILNFVLGAGSWVAHTSIHIDNMAHLGGFLTGLALAVPMVPRIGAPPPLFRRRRAAAVLGMATLLLLLAYGVRSFYLPLITHAR